MKKILTVVGARPQFIKAAVISRLLRSDAWKGLATERLVHTGQHYDANMSEIFFSEMRIPKADVNLGIGGGGHGAMTGEMLARLEVELQSYRPDIVMIYGDTNSTLAGALAASKLHLPVAHIEAGLRSRDKGMPEEQNRLVADHLSTWLLCPTEAALANLKHEGIADCGGRAPSSDHPRVAKVGDVMLDASLFYRSIAASRPIAERLVAKLGLQGSFRLLTLHRAENTDDSDRLLAIFKALNEANDLPLVFPVHPRTRKMLEASNIEVGKHIRMLDPVGYLDMLDLEAGCERVITDSGGVQKEAYFFGKPCLTLRDTTEWVETVESGWNQLVGVDPDEIVQALARPLPGGERAPHYGSGDAGTRILETILDSR
ncbi:MAG: UDP-N-acetylglucosamine 2-epimerase (non-hydrolyzing) [Spirochaetota bacterium]